MLNWFEHEKSFIISGQGVSIRFKVNGYIRQNLLFFWKGSQMLKKEVASLVCGTRKTWTTLKGKSVTGVPRWERPSLPTYKINGIDVYDD